MHSFRSNGHLWGWAAPGHGALGPWTRCDRGYLIEFANRSPDLAVGVALMISSRSGQVCAGTGSIFARRASARSRD